MIALAASSTTYAIFMFLMTEFSPAMSIKLPKSLLATKVMLSKVIPSPTMMNPISFNTALSPVMVKALSIVM